jgi:hypothetical protein
MRGDHVLIRHLRSFGMCHAFGDAAGRDRDTTFLSATIPVSPGWSRVFFARARASDLRLTIGFHRAIGAAASPARSMRR